MYLPFDQIGKLSKLKGVSFVNLNFATRLHKSICNWKELRYFSTQSVSFINGTLIPDCIGDEWKYLERFEIYSITPSNENIAYSFHEKLLNLDNIKEIYLFNLNFNITSFQQFSSVSSSLLNVNFQGSNICDEYTMKGTNITRYTASNMTYLDYIASTSNKNILKNFIDDYQPCFTPCNELDAFCNADNWGDGICDSLCDQASCEYDQCKRLFFVGWFSFCLFFFCIVHFIILFNIYNGYR